MTRFLLPRHFFIMQIRSEFPLGSWTPGAGRSLVLNLQGLRWFQRPVTLWLTQRRRF